MKWNSMLNLIVGIFSIICALIEGFFIGRLSWVLMLGGLGISNIVYSLYVLNKFGGFVEE